MGNKVLICDDSADILEMTSMILEIGGYEPLTEIDSTNFIARALKELPDVLLLDLWMPFLPGDQLAIAIRNTPELAHLPIIIFSAAIDLKNEAIRAGADYYINKPFEMEELLKIIYLAASKQAPNLK